MFDKRVSKVTICCFLFICIQSTGYSAQSQDQTSSRTNTLFDDADDIQRQLDNEARDRIKFGRVSFIANKGRRMHVFNSLQPKTIWVFHFPTHYPDHNSIMNHVEQQVVRYPREYSAAEKKTDDEDYDESMITPPLPSSEWDYNNQAKWIKHFPDCGGKSQSPVDLPITGLIKARGARNLLFQNYDVEPKSMLLENDGKRVVLSGEWKSEQRPLIYGGAAHSRRYLFHSMALHLPSEHTVGGLQYPLESQALYVSAEYKGVEEALEASPSDPQAFLAVANLYKYSNHTHKGIEEILSSAKSLSNNSKNVSLSAKCLSHFNPPFKEYACYQGSMTVPPCTESVLWLIRGRALSIMRETVEAAQSLMVAEGDPKHLFFRNAQPLNDRKVFLFN
ncbi:carbonic anhydrase 1-like isoform X2 [Trichoplusia ni]|uniref:Carbonic anhydrase 1-like isoform X2 n=1 Tax=Trichoplusia ni TaxID=7111 RepID=A0A7E5WB65_TRINI|nr:carbonic anhydrase 1-like isoform X2 [Trichoplusia ni]